jgi:hypothetical protein
MGRPPLNVTVINLNIDDADMKRVSALGGPHRLSKFVRDAVRYQLDQVAPDEAEAGPPYFEGDGGQEQRLSVSGRAAIFANLRKKKASLDQLQAAFGFDDPVDFIHVLLGHRSLPNQTARVVVKEVVGKPYDPSVG